MKKIVVTLAVVLASTAFPAGASAGGPPPGLTSAGRTLWNFEALLYDTFHVHGAGVTGRWNFSCNGGPSCGSLSQFTTYDFVFAHPSRSPFHLVPHRTRSFGNYPEPVEVKSQDVACDPAGTRFLITYGSSATLDLACLKPLS
jgi:hypothetical protein